MELLVKFAKAVIQIEQNLLKQKSLNESLGIGNAIVDVICKVEDKFITQNNLTKSTMKLADETEFKKLLSTLKIEETVLADQWQTQL